MLTYFTRYPLSVIRLSQEWMRLIPKNYIIIVIISHVVSVEIV